MRGRRFKTQADIERYTAQGYGQGQVRTTGHGCVCKMFHPKAVPAKSPA